MHFHCESQANGQEIKAGMIEGMKLKQTYQQNEIQDGDIICYQVEMTQKEYVPYSVVWLALTFRVDDLENQNLYSSVPLFYDFLQNRVLVQFKPRYEDPNIVDFDLMLSKKMTYEVVGGLYAPDGSCLPSDGG